MILETWNNKSKQEKLAWLSLLIITAIGGYYLSKIGVFIEIADFENPSVRHAMKTIFILAIVGEVVSYLFSYQKKGGIEEDERDKSIKHKSEAVAYRTLLGGIVLLLGQIVVWGKLGEYIASNANLEKIGNQLSSFDHYNHSPLLIANLLLVLLIFSAFTKYLSKVIYYNRGY